MNQNEVTRPDAPNKKIKTSDDFELCYLRHRYFRKVKYNPTEQEMLPYMKIVEKNTANTFFTNFKLFKMIGFYKEDVLNIGRVHLISFLGLFDLNSNQQKRNIWKAKFLAKNNFQEPHQSQIDNQNKANFTLFLNQRMDDLVRISRQKVRNIYGKQSGECVVFYSKNYPPKYPNELLKNHSELGFKKLSLPIFKSIRRKAKVNKDATIFEFGGFWYVAIHLEQRNLTLDEVIAGGSNPYDNFHNMRPDEVYDEKEWKDLHGSFKSKPKNRKVLILKKFIARNKNNRQYREELVIAKKLLKKMEN